MAEEKPGTGYRDIVAHYEDCLAQHGDSHLGVDWPNREDAIRRYEVMLGVIHPPAAGQRVSLLDFGCGASHLYEYIRARGLDHIDYAGLDLSERFVVLSQNKFPQKPYYCADLLEDDSSVPSFDYVVMNGVFTEKREMEFDAMLAYFKRLLLRVWEHVETGIAFNVMSKQVDWERDDLFHLPLDILADFLTGQISRHFVIRNDYGLYEYSVYVYRRPFNG